jgi:hypothetical protein
LSEGAYSGRLLFGLLILRHDRREILWLGVTAHPTITEAFPWDTAPTFLIRDNDCAYGEVFTRRARSMGIRDRPSRLDRHGRTDMSSAQSARSDVSV